MLNFIQFHYSFTVGSFLHYIPKKVSDDEVSDIRMNLVWSTKRTDDGKRWLVSKVIKAIKIGYRMVAGSDLVNRKLIPRSPPINSLFYLNNSLGEEYKTISVRLVDDGTVSLENITVSDEIFPLRLDVVRMLYGQASVDLLQNENTQEPLLLEAGEFLQLNAEADINATKLLIQSTFTERNVALGWSTDETKSGKRWLTIKATKNIGPGRIGETGISLVKKQLIASNKDNDVCAQQSIPVRLVDNHGDFAVSTKTVPLRIDAVRMICGGTSISLLQNHYLLHQQETREPLLLGASAFGLLNAEVDNNVTLKTIQDILSSSLVSENR